MNRRLLTGTPESNRLTIGAQDASGESNPLSFAAYQHLVKNGQSFSAITAAPGASLSRLRRMVLQQVGVVATIGTVIGLGLAISRR